MLCEGWSLFKDTHLMASHKSDDGLEHESAMI